MENRAFVIIFVHIPPPKTQPPLLDFVALINILSVSVSYKNIKECCSQALLPGDAENKQEQQTENGGSGLPGINPPPGLKERLTGRLQGGAYGRGV